MFAILKNMKRVALTGLLTGVVSMSLAACGGDATPTTAPHPTSTVVSQASNGTSDAAPTKGTTNTIDSTGSDGEVQEVELIIKEWAIEPANITVKPGKIRFTVTNTGQFSHNVTVKNGSSTLGATPTFGPAEGVKTFEVELEAGTYVMLCSLPGHEAQGQRGTITVK